ncbi:MAG: YicC/YloC family endoribonuclease [Bacteroidales bacterium]
MIKSMTGYGKAVGEYGGKQITVELKSLNSKQLDLSMKTPSRYLELEPEIRNQLARMLERGKLYCSVQVDAVAEGAVPEINMELAEACYDQLKALEQKLGLEGRSDYLSLLVRMPDVFRTQQSVAGAEEQQAILAATLQAIGSLDEFRQKEGEILGKDIIQRIGLIGTLLKEVEPFEQQRMIRLRERIVKDLEVIMDKGYDQNRFEQEMIYYLEKLDITEEKTRLKSHLDYFLQVMGEDSANGRKLGFIAQEIGREVNTLGSKANDADVQKIVIRMKDELEKIKEQLLNIL